MTIEEYGQPYWFDEPVPELGMVRTEHCYGEDSQFLTMMKLRILRSVVPSIATQRDLRGMGPSVMQLTYLPASGMRHRDLIPNKDIMLFQFSKRATERFPELADLPFRKFNQMDLSQPKGTP